MDYIHTLFSKETKIGRTLRGALQLLATILTFFAGLLVIPGVHEFVTTNNYMTVASFVTLNAVITYTYNAVEAVLDYLGDK